MVKRKIWILTLVLTMMASLTTLNAEDITHDPNMIMLYDDLFIDLDDYEDYSQFEGQVYAIRPGVDLHIVAYFSTKYRFLVKYSYQFSPSGKKLYVSKGTATGGFADETIWRGSPNIARQLSAPSWVFGRPDLMGGVSFTNNTNTGIAFVRIDFIGVKEPR